jgi:Protein of unknown function (DUF2934)
MESIGMMRENKAPKASPVGAEKIGEPLPTRAEIARRAYEIFLERGEVHGRDLDDWFQAEHELKDERR